jgi:hypothetical protein
MGWAWTHAMRVCWDYACNFAREHRSTIERLARWLYNKRELSGLEVAVHLNRIDEGFNSPGPRKPRKTKDLDDVDDLDALSVDQDSQTDDELNEEDEFETPGPDEDENTIEDSPNPTKVKASKQKARRLDRARRMVSNRWLHLGRRGPCRCVGLGAGRARPVRTGRPLLVARGSVMQVETAKKEEPGRLLQRAVHDYVRAVRSAPDALPVIAPVVYEMLRETMLRLSCFGSGTLDERRTATIGEFLVRLELKLSHLDDARCGEILRIVRAQFDEQCRCIIKLRSSWSTPMTIP